MSILIGITPSISNDETEISQNLAYARAISLCGAIPVVLPYVDVDISELLHRLDGVLFGGGGDIDPLIFDVEPPKECGQISPRRDMFELELCKKAIDKKIPILGICRGLQLLNAAAGGGIIWDIVGNIKHSQSSPKYHKSHSIRIFPETPLFDILHETKIAVNSFHHQAIDNSVLEIFANSLDNVIEAGALKNHPFALGVQWHPEHLLYDKAQLRIFKAFVAACKNNTRE